jgi:hypothetical protein
VFYNSIIEENMWDVKKYGGIKAESRFLDLGKELVEE